jgi:CHAT domain-containing protein
LLERGIEFAKQIPSGGNKVHLEGQLHSVLGARLLNQDKTQEAIKHISYALQVQESWLASLVRSNRNFHRGIQNAQSGVILTLEKLGVAYDKAGDRQDSIKAYERALAMIKGSQLERDRRTLIRIHQKLGRMRLSDRDYLRALENFQRVLTLGEELQYATSMQTANSQIGRIFLQSERPVEAIPYLRKAIDSIESARSQLESEDLRVSFFERQGTTYSSFIRANLAINNLDDAFNYTERARSRAFLDILGSKVQLGRQSALIEEEKKLQESIKQLRAKQTGETDEEDDEDVREVGSQTSDLAAAEKAYVDFLAKVRKENKEQASLMNVEPLTLKQVQELLDHGVTMLEYFVTQDSVILWIVEKDQVASVTVPLRRGQLQSRVNSFREAIQQFEEKDKFKQQAIGLYKTLIQPALPYVKGKELLIIPHDVLHYLPFQALLASDGQYLVEKYPINYLSSASLMQFTQEKRKAKGELSAVLAQGGKVLTFGNPDLKDPKKNLQYAGFEAKQIKSLCPQSTIYLEKEATEEKAKSLSPQNDIIHFASHAELNENDPLGSAILLAKSDKEDGRLEVREIFGMDLKASLVVLSACETGLGKLSSGDELVGLTRAFIYAGTPSVVASLWNVEDSSTAQLMASFYKNLKTMTKVEALRQAQLQLIRGNVNSELLARRGIGGVGKLGEAAQPKLDSSLSSSVSNSTSVSTSHPYFWAPFILVGEGK